MYYSRTYVRTVEEEKKKKFAGLCYVWMDIRFLHKGRCEHEVEWECQIIYALGLFEGEEESNLNSSM